MKPSKQGMPSMHSMHRDTGEGWHLGCGLPETCCNATMPLPQYCQGKVSFVCTSIDTQTLWKLALTSPLNHAVEQQGSQRALWVSNMITTNYFNEIVSKIELRIMSLLLHGHSIKAHAGWHDMPESRYML